MSRCALLKWIHSGKLRCAIPRFLLYALLAFAFLQFSALASDGPTGKSEASAQETSSTTVLPDGTAIQLRITQTLSPAHAKVGDTVEFQVVDHVKVGDLIVIPRRAIATGVVVEIRPRRP